MSEPATTVIAPAPASRANPGAPAPAPANGNPAPAAAQPPAPDPRAAAEAKEKSRRRRPFIIGALVLVALGGIGYWLYDRQFEETDDAQIDGNISNISPRVSGTVKAVYVDDNQTVKEGQLLLELDATDLEVAQAQAKAQVASAEAQLQVEDPNVSITESTNRATISGASSDVISAEAAIAGAKSDVEQLAAQLEQAIANDKNNQLVKVRADQLIADKAIPQSDYDARVAQASASTANVEAIKQALASAKERVRQAQARLGAAQSHSAEVQANAPRQLVARRASVLVRQAALDLAQAQLKEATNNIGYTKIGAPVAGIVGKKSVAVGDRIAPGQELLAVAQIDGLWVTANFRETQLRKIKVGDSASVHVDALSQDFTGVVESVAGATGSRFSVLPPENAAGNYVKVVQRLPVRIKLDPQQAGLDRLRPGMSVEPKVRLR